MENEQFKLQMQRWVKKLSTSDLGLLHHVTTREYRRRQNGHTRAFLKKTGFNKKEDNQ